MTNPFRRQDVSSPTGDGSEPSVPMPRFGISSSTTSNTPLDAANRFPPADQITGVSQSLDQPQMSGTGRLVQPTSSLPSSSQQMSRVMDVDSFKNLLMTGNTESAGSGTTLGSTKESSYPDEESSSSVERLTQYHPHNSRSIVEDQGSSSDYTDSELEETTENVTSPQRLKGKPPPPPKSKHGKAIQPKGPQTVSFDDFAPTIESNEPPVFEHKKSLSTPKPLPPKPVPQSLQKSVSEPIQFATREVRSFVPASPKLATEYVPGIPASDEAPAPTAAKKSAPPPPVARRSTVTKRSRGNTASSMHSVNDDQPLSRATSLNDPNPKSPPPPPPPPPPTRRMGSSSNIISPPMSLDQPPTYSRGTLEPTITRSRSSSQASLASPPPAPPARRRSSKASIEVAQRPNSTVSANASRRTSSEMPRSSMDSGRAQFLSQNDVSIEEEVAEKENQSLSSPNKSKSAVKPLLQTLPSGDDILADMEALQKEIDSLRAKYGNG